MIGAVRELLSDSAGKVSCFRVMAMMGMVCGCAVMLLQVLGYGQDARLEGTLAVLFGVIFGGKAWQRSSESRTQL